MVASRSVCEVLAGFREAADALAAVDPVVAADGPSVVELLIEWATTPQFHRFAGELREWLNEVDPDGSDKRAGKTHDGRRVHLSQSFEDTWLLDRVLDPIGGEIVKTVLSGIEREFAQGDKATAADSARPA